MINGIYILATATLALLMFIIGMLYGEQKQEEKDKKDLRHVNDIVNRLEKLQNK